MYFHDWCIRTEGISHVKQSHYGPEGECCIQWGEGMVRPRKAGALRVLFGAFSAGTSIPFQKPLQNQAGASDNTSRVHGFKVELCKSQARTGVYVWGKSTFPESGWWMGPCELEWGQGTKATDHIHMLFWTRCPHRQKSWKFFCSQVHDNTVDFVPFTGWAGSHYKSIKRTLTNVDLCPDGERHLVTVQFWHESLSLMYPPEENSNSP